MSERMVILKSGVPGTVSVIYPQYGINRRWAKMGQPMEVPFELVKQCLWENGFNRMIQSGILYIDNMQDKIDLGLEPADAKEPVNIIVFDEPTMRSLLTEAPYNDFVQKISNAPKLQVDNLIDYAIEEELIDMKKCDYLKQLTKRDILKSISSKREDIEAEKRAEQEEKARKQARE